MHSKMSGSLGHGPADGGDELSASQCPAWGHLVTGDRSLTPFVIFCTARLGTGLLSVTIRPVTDRRPVGQDSASVMDPTAIFPFFFFFFFFFSEGMPARCCLLRDCACVVCWNIARHSSLFFCLFFGYLFFFWRGGRGGVSSLC